MNILAAILVAAVCTQSEAGSAKPVQAKGAFVAIVVKDMDASIHWYESNLGLRFLKRSTAPRKDAENAVLQGDGFFIELIHFFHRAVGARPPTGDGSLPLGLRKAGAVLESKSFDEVSARLKASKAEFRGGVFEDREM